jgi:restriction system protein
MPIPDFQTIMLPLLEMFRDGDAKTTTQMYAELGDHFGLTEQERTERFTIGKSNPFSESSWMGANTPQEGWALGKNWKRPL